MNLADLNKTSSAAGMFSKDTTGYLVGEALSNPYAMTASLEAGRFAPTNSSDILVGGQFVAVSAVGTLKKATGQIDFNAISVNASNAVTAPWSRAPQVPSGGSASFYRKGSGIRVAVNCDAAVASAILAGTATDAAWDFTNQKAVATGTAGAVALSSMGVQIITANGGNSRAISTDASTNSNWVDASSALVVQI